MVELLVVLGIIGILAALTLTSLTGVRRRAQRLECQMNLATLQLAWGTYANDHNGRLVSNADTGDIGGRTGGWISGNMRLSYEAGSTVLIQQPGASLLAPYFRNPKALRCPSDRAARMRSFSLNCRMNPTRAASAGAPRWVGGGGTNYLVYRGRDQMRQPSQLFTFLDEREETINDGSFATDLSHTGNPAGVGIANPYYLIDFPADRHKGGANLAFADGRVDWHRWVEATTRPPRGTAVPRTQTTPADRDVQWLHEHAAEPR